MLAALLAPPARALERPRVAATRAADPIRVDGVLDEADWARAAPITALRRIEDREGEAPSESTEVRVLFDAAHVYFGFRCFNRGPGAIRASLAPRDQILDLDYAGVLLDTYQDRHRAYAFAVNPYGVQLDGIFIGEDVSTEWDGVWDAEVTRDGSGWTAEMAIPLRTLSFPERGSGAWGFMVRRQIAKTAEICTWPLVRADVAGDDMLQAADLTGLDGLRGGGLFDLQPYAASTWTTQRGEDGAWTDRDAPRRGGGRARAAHLDAGAERHGEPRLQPGRGRRAADRREPALPALLRREAPVLPRGRRHLRHRLRPHLHAPHRRPGLRRQAHRPARATCASAAWCCATTAAARSTAWAAGRPRACRAGAGSSSAGPPGSSARTRASARWWPCTRRTTPGRRTMMPSRTWGVGRRSGGANAVYALDADLRLSRRWFFHGQLAGSRTRARPTPGPRHWDSAGVPGT